MTPCHHCGQPAVSVTVGGEWHCATCRTPTQIPPSQSPRLQAGARARAEAEAKVSTDGKEVDLQSEGTSEDSIEDRDGDRDSGVSVDRVERDKYVPEMRMLLEDWRAGRIDPVLVSHGRLELGAPAEDGLIFGDLIVRQGLQLAVHEDRPVPYATREAVDAGHARHAMQASRALHRLERAGLIECVGSMRRRPGTAYGTRLFRVLPPPGAADQVREVVGEALAPESFEPHVEVPHEPLVDRAELAARVPVGVPASGDGTGSRASVHQIPSEGAGYGGSTRSLHGQPT